MTQRFEDAETLGRHEIWSGSVGRFGEEDVRLPDGRTLKLAVLEHPGACAVVPLLPTGKVVMLRQYRHAVHETLWEIPAGKLDPGEAIQDCARRELREETGYTAVRLEPLGSIFVTPGYSDEVIHLFIARELTPGPQSLGDNESIQCHELDFSEAVRMAERGEIRDAKTVIGLLRARSHTRAP